MSRFKRKTTTILLALCLAAATSGNAGAATNKAYQSSNSIFVGSAVVNIFNSFWSWMTGALLRDPGPCPMRSCGGEDPEER